MMVVRRYSESTPGNWVYLRWMLWCSVCGDGVQPGLQCAWVTVPAGQMRPPAPTGCPLYTTNFLPTFRTSCLPAAHSLTLDCCHEHPAASLSSWSRFLPVSWRRSLWPLRLREGQTHHPCPLHCVLLLPSGWTTQCCTL